MKRAMWAILVRSVAVLQKLVDFKSRILHLNRFDLREHECDQAPDSEIDANSVIKLRCISSVRVDDTTTRNENCGVGHPKSAVKCKH